MGVQAGRQTQLKRKQLWQWRRSQHHPQRRRRHPHQLLMKSLRWLLNGVSLRPLPRHLLPHQG